MTGQWRGRTIAHTGRGTSLFKKIFTKCAPLCRAKPTVISRPMAKCFTENWMDREIGGYAFGCPPVLLPILLQASQTRKNQRGLETYAAP